MSSSEDSFRSTGTTASESEPLNQPSMEVFSADNKLSLVAEFDELMRFTKLQRYDEMESVFIENLNQTCELAQAFAQSRKECVRLQEELDHITHEYTDLENKLGMSRKLFDQERKRHKKTEEDRDALRTKLANIAELLFSNYRYNLPNEIQQQLAGHVPSNKGLESKQYPPNLSAIQEVNTTGSLLSDFSYSRSEDDLDVSIIPEAGTWKKHRPSEMNAETDEPAAKKRRSAHNKSIPINSTDVVRATTTVSVPKDGPITATSIIEAVPQTPEYTNGLTTPMKRKGENIYHPSAPPEHVIIAHTGINSSPTTANLINLRKHVLQAKTVMMPENCGVCSRRIGFGKQSLKCKNCRSTCHPECKEKIFEVPCVTIGNTPTQRGATGIISDYAPVVPPMVPSLIIHCLNQIETRGFTELGIYRIPGSERDVQNLKEKLLRSKTTPNLNQMDIHVICGTVKNFLRSLSDSLITRNRWEDFVRASEARDPKDIEPLLCELIADLPRSNRDTLAYMILHLQRIAESPDCRMPISNLAKVFGPTIIGYSSTDIDQRTLIIETKQITALMEKLLGLPTHFWSTFLSNGNGVPMTPSSKLQQTPSTDSLLYPSAKKTLLGYGSKSAIKKKQKIFPPQPMFKS